MKINYELIDKFLNAVFPLPSAFGTQNGDVPFEFRQIKRKIRKIDENAQLCYGLSKMVIISSLLNDVVIKIPFNGYYDGAEWYPFIYATGSKEDDYCTSEFEKYNTLKNMRLNQFVAKTIFYKEIDNRRVFLQEKVVPLNNYYSGSKPSFYSLKIAKEWDKEGLLEINTTWIANCIDFYGKEKVETFLNYCDNIDLDILEDAHSGNYGYREDGSPAILDFSNFLDTII